VPTGIKMTRRLGVALAFLLAGTCAAEAQTPASPPPTAKAGGANNLPAFRTWLEALWPEASAFGISRATFDAAFAGVEADLTLPDLEIPGRAAPSGGQAEFTRPPQDYLKRSQLDGLAATGRALAERHAAPLDTVERKVGVERAVVLAIWGRETAFGTYKLPHYAIKVLATQAYTGRRKDMFRQELLFGLRMLERKIVTIPAMRSSWAGAIGLTQFMPSEVFSSGIDIDGDGRIDLINSVPDALGSAAKQLKDKGWTFGLPWGFEVRLPASVDCANEGPLNARTLAEWASAGVGRADGRPFPPEHADKPAYLMSPGGSYGPQFLVTDNFKVIRAYNTSDLYAVFVGHLGDRIAGGGDFRTPWGAIAQLPTRDVEEIQRRLQQAGAKIDKIDGKIGSNTRWQIGQYQRQAKLRVDCWPTAGLLAALRAGR
jgi:lytic murein transglycosylase